MDYQHKSWSSSSSSSSVSHNVIVFIPKTMRVLGEPNIGPFPWSTTMPMMSSWWWMKTMSGTNNRHFYKLSGRQRDVEATQRESLSWRFRQPRTFKALLLQHVHRKDFTFRDGSWLIKATDSDFFCRVSEVSGVDRVGYILQAITSTNGPPHRQQ
jgi:hypothetical protein